jgi:putative IMPACT (imprinted ancient) family translation regulator
VGVARYFGGIKLGAGGLTRAYSGACEAVLSVLPLEQHRILLSRLIHCDFANEQPLRHWAETHDAQVMAVDYGEQVRMELALPMESLSDLEAFCSAHNLMAELP